MRPGITIQHAREIAPESELVRSDRLGLLGVVPRARWPRGGKAGDYLEMPLHQLSDLESNPARALFDPVSRRAVRSFFQNGGQTCRLFGLCLNSEADLMSGDAFLGVFHALQDRLRGEEDLGLLAMPVLAWLPPTADGPAPGDPVLDVLLRHCQEMNNRFLVIDPPRSLHGDALLAYVDAFRERNRVVASYGAIYYPWLMDGEETLPPSGCIAGIYARTEHAHAPFGVRWPPANEVVRGVTHPAVPVKAREIERLSAHHINPIITQPARGVVVWGARTLSLDEQWMHINSRRIVSFISEQLRRDSEWVVFEHQRPELWEIVTRTVRSRLDMLWAAGLLTGDQAGLQYQVKCDGELNPPEVREAGRVNVRVMLRPVATAEHIVVELRLGS